MELYKATYETELPNDHDDYNYQEVLINAPNLVAATRFASRFRLKGFTQHYKFKIEVGTYYPRTVDNEGNMTNSCLFYILQEWTE